MKIRQNDFEHHIKNLVSIYKNPKFLVALSGGADSLCLCFMLKAFADKIQGSVFAAIVDHKIRPESTQEALSLRERLEGYGIDSIILSVDKDFGEQGIQHKARNERYFLLKSYAKANDFPYLFLAHHLDDQIETMLLRESMGENLVGDSGMSAKVVCDQVITIRPLLDYTKDQIIETLRDFTDTWVEDPSNNNTKYTRVRYRQQISKLDVTEKQTLITRLKSNIAKRDYIERSAINLLSRGVLINKLGLIKIKLDLFHQYEENIQIFVLRKLIRFANSQAYEIKINKIKRLLLIIRETSSMKFSLGNCLLKSKKGFLYIFKNRVLEAEVLKYPKQHQFWWNKRFLIKLAKGNHFVSNITKSVYYNIMEKYEFKKFCKTYEIDGDFIWGLPYIYYGQEHLEFSLDSYEQILYRSSSPVFMNFFINL